MQASYLPLFTQAAAASDACIVTTGVAGAVHIRDARSATITLLAFYQGNQAQRLEVGWLAIVALCYLQHQVARPQPHTYAFVTCSGELTG